LPLNEVQIENIVVTSPYNMFKYSIRTELTRKYYERKIRTFYDFIKLLPNSRIETRCDRFAEVAIKDHDLTFSKIMGFLQFRKERVERYCNKYFERWINYKKVR